MADFKGFIRLTRIQFNTLKTSGTLTVGGQTLTYDPINTYYLCTTKDEMYLDDYVDLFTDQEIAGDKKFTGNVTATTINSNQYNDASGTSLMNNGGGTSTQIGSSSRPTRLYSSAQPEWYKNGESQGVLALKSEVDAVQTNLNNVDKSVVHLAGEEIITGKKTFSSEIIGSSGASITGKTNLKGDAAITGALAVSEAVTLSGDLTVKGNITQEGDNYKTHAEEVYSKNDYIYLREGNTGALTAGKFSGLEFINYDGTNNGRLVVDMNGVARVGDVGDEQPLATREETPISNAVAYWDSDNKNFITNSNVYISDNHLYSNSKQVVNLSDTQTLTNKTLSTSTKVGVTLLPTATNTYDLGSSSYKFKNIYATTYYGSMGAALTLQSSATATTTYNGSTARTLSSYYMDLFTAQAAAGNKTFTGITKVSELYPVTSDSSTLGHKSGQRFQQVVANEHVITENGSAEGWKLSTDSDGTLNFIFE